MCVVCDQKNNRLELVNAERKGRSSSVLICGCETVFIDGYIEQFKSCGTKGHQSEMVALKPAADLRSIA